ASDLERAGIKLGAVVDVRAGEAVVDTFPSSPLQLPSPARGEGQGGGSLQSVIVAPLTGSGPRRKIECDLLCVSGGFNPTLHLFSQAQGRLHYDEGLACFVPQAALPDVEVVGAA